MAYLIKRGSWYYGAFSDATRTPTQKRVALRTRQKREAERLLIGLEDAFLAGTYDPWTSARLPTSGEQNLDSAPSATVASTIEAFLKTRTHRAAQTQQKYRSVLRLLVRFHGARRPVITLTAKAIQDFLHGAERAPVTRKTYLTTLSPYLGWLASEGYLEDNPARGVQLERVPRTFPRYLLPEDVQAIVHAIEATAQANKHTNAGASLWLIPVVQANVYLGLRAAEVTALRWDDVDVDRRELTVSQRDGFTTKNGRDRRVPLSAPVEAILASLPSSCPFVFPSYHNRALHPRYLSRRFKHFARLAGLPEHINFHSTRHTACSWLVMQGASLEAARRYMGHSSITVTQRYAHLAPDAFRGQVEDAFRRVAE
ncbi:MAG: site-specific integrase [Bacteroidota bacterium]